MNVDQSLKDVSSVHMAWVTGHKLTNIRREFVSAMLGNVYFCKLDGKLMKLTDARKILEQDYLSKPR